MGEVPALPNGWVPCIISFDGDQEEVAYGPQVMMDRLSKWLDKHFERVTAEKAAPTAEPIDEYQRGRRAGITEFYDSLYAIDQDRARAALHKIEPQPAPADGWLHSSGMLYRLTDERRPKNCDEINVTMADGSRSLESRSRLAGELLDCIRAMQAAADKKEPT